MTKFRPRVNIEEKKASVETCLSDFGNTTEQSKPTG